MKKDSQLHLRASESDKDVLKKATKIREDITGQPGSISSTIIHNAEEYVSHVPNRILINDHSIEAAEFIEQLEMKYIPAITFIQNRIEWLGVRITDELLFSTLSGNFNKLEMASALVNASSCNSSSAAALSQAQSSFRNIFDQERGSISRILDERIDSKPLSDESFLQYLSFEEGKPFISDSTKAQIIESFKTYVISRKGAIIHKFHQKAAQDLQGLIASMKDTRAGVELNYNPWKFISGFFEVTTDEDGNWMIKARQVDYNRLTEDPEVEE